MAMVSREALEDVRCGFIGELPDDSEASAERAETGDQRQARWRAVLNLYVPNGSGLKSEKYPYKLTGWPVCVGISDAQAERGEPLCMVGTSTSRWKPATSMTPTTDRRNHGQLSRA